MTAVINIREHLSALSPLFEPKNSSICHPSHNTPSFTSTSLHQEAQSQLLTHTHGGQQSWWIGLLYLPVSERDKGKLDGRLSSILCTVCLSVVWLCSISSLNGKHPRSQSVYPSCSTSTCLQKQTGSRGRVWQDRATSVYNIQPNDLPATPAVEHAAHTDELHYRGSSTGMHRAKFAIHINTQTKIKRNWGFFFFSHIPALAVSVSSFHSGP